jgi:3-hydroxy-9,10-secoandrosta-1,3,5(10)-triene-9,17-dione monooxygenase
LFVGFCCGLARLAPDCIRAAVGKPIRIALVTAAAVIDIGGPIPQPLVVMPAPQSITKAIPESQQLIARARAMIPLLAGRAAQAEQDRRLPDSTIADMQEAGLFRVLQPRRWGGYELDMATFWEIQLALAEGHMSTAWVYGVVGLHPWLLALFDDRAASDVWAKDDATLVCSSLMPAGTATRVPDGFRVSGSWKYSSGCEHCDWAFLGVTQTVDPSRKPDRSILLVPRSDYRIVDTWRVSGLKATGSHDLVVEDVFVPEYRLIEFADAFLGVAPGLALNTSALYRLPFGQIFFRGVSTGALGALQGMLNVFLDYGSKRIARGGPTASDPMVQLTCAEVAAGIDEMKTILHRNFAHLQEYAERGEMPPLAVRVEYKFHSARVAERCSRLASKLFKAAGSAGIYDGLPFGRILADVNAARQHISNQYEMLGRNWAAAMFGTLDNKDLML